MSAPSESSSVALVGVGRSLGEELLLCAQSPTATPDQLADLLTPIDAAPPSARTVALTCRDVSGRSSLHHACLVGRPWMVRALLLRSESAPMVAAQDGQGQTPLHLALKAGNQTTADDRPVDRLGAAAAAAASSSSSSSSSQSQSESRSQAHADCAHAILDVEERRQQVTPGEDGEAATKKAKLNEPTADGAAASTSASSSRSGAAAASASSSSALASPPSTSLLTLRDSFGRLPLHWSVSTPALLLRCLHLQGGLVDAATQSGDTPLHWAAADGDLEAVDLLLSAGASTESINGRGETPMDVARSPATKGALQAWKDKRQAQGKGPDQTTAGADADVGTVSASALARSTGGGQMTSAAPKKKTAIKMKAKPA